MEGTGDSTARERSGTRRLDRVVAVGAVFIAGYLGVLVWHGPERVPEPFPIFNWSLFSTVPDPEATDYSIRFTRVNGQDLDPPVYFEQADRWVPAGNSEAYQARQRLGRATENGELLRMANARELLESTFFGSITRADYEVVRRRFDIIDRHRCECFVDETVLAELETAP